MVPILRRFQIERDGEGVSITGTLPASFVRKLVERGEWGQVSTCHIEGQVSTCHIER